MDYTFLRGVGCGFRVARALNFRVQVVLGVESLRSVFAGRVAPIESV